MKVRSEPCLFTEREAVFLCRGGLARVATVSQDGQPHVVPVAFEFDGRYIYFSGRQLVRSLKFRHLILNDRVAIVIDEIVSTDPWIARGIEVRGVAELLAEGGHPYVRICPLTKASWGI
jgi:pyridoxamine 5'-phosphate oxidase family protein